MNKLEQNNLEQNILSYDRIEYIVYKLNEYIKLYEEEKISKEELEQNIINLSEELKGLYNSFPSEVHDLNNVILFFRESLEDKKYLENTKELLDKFFKKEFTETDIIKLANSITNKLGMSLSFEIVKIDKMVRKGYYEGSISFNKFGKVNLIDNECFSYKETTKDRIIKLFGKKIDIDFDQVNISKNILLNFTGPINSILLNTIKNAKEAGADDVKIILSNSYFSDMIILKVVDNGKGMDTNTVKNILFKKGVSTKTDSGTNMGVGMYELVSNFLLSGGELELYSKIDGDKIEFNYYSGSVNTDNIVPIKDHMEDSIYDSKIEGKNGTEFVFKFRNNKNDKS